MKLKCECFHVDNMIELPVQPYGRFSKIT